MYKQRATGILTRKLDDEYILLDTETGYMHVLNEIGYSVWCMLCQPDSLDGVVNRVLDKYDCPADATSVTQDVSDLINRLLEHGLLMDSESPIESEAD